MVESPTSLQSTIRGNRVIESAIQGRENPSEKRVPPGTTEAFISSPTRTAIYRQVRRLEVKSAHGKEPTPDDLINLYSQVQGYLELKEGQDSTPQGMYNRRLLLYLPTNLFLPPLDSIPVQNSSYLNHEALRSWYVTMRKLSLQALQSTLADKQFDTREKKEIS